MASANNSSQFSNRSNQNSVRRRSHSPGRQIAIENSSKLNDLNERIKTVVSQNHKLENENQRLFDLLSKMKNDQKLEIDSALKSYITEINHLRSSHSAESSENGRLKLEIENHQQKTDELMKSISKINANLQSRIADNQKLANENTSLKSNLELEKSKSLEYFRIGEEFKHQTQELTLKIDSLEQKLSNEKVKFVEMENKFKSDLETVKFETNLLNKNAQNDSQEKQKPTSAYDSNLSAELFFEQEKIAENYEIKLEELKNTLLEAHREEIENLENLIRDQDHLIETLKEENQTISAQLEAEKSKEKLMNDLKKKLEEVQEKNFLLSKDLFYKNSELNDVAKINTNLNYSIDSLQKHLDVKNSRCAANESFQPKRFRFDNEKPNLYTEISSSGPLRITKVCPEGEFVEISNQFTEDILLEGLKLVQKLPNGESFELKFNSDDKISANNSMTITNYHVQNNYKVKNSFLNIGTQTQLDTVLCDDNDPTIASCIIRNVNQPRFGNFGKYIRNIFSR